MIALNRKIMDVQWLCVCLHVLAAQACSTGLGMPWAALKVYGSITLIGSPRESLNVQEEFAQRYLGYNHPAKKQLLAQRRASNALPKPFRYADIPESSLPASVDWRERNAVTEVGAAAVHCPASWPVKRSAKLHFI